MPTTEDNPGSSRCEISSIGRGYEAGYDDGLQRGERRGWENGIEAAAEWLESQEGYGSRNRLEYAFGIRKLKKE